MHWDILTSAPLHTSIVERNLFIMLEMRGAQGNSQTAETRATARVHHTPRTEKKMQG